MFSPGRIITGVVGVIGALWLGVAGGFLVWQYDRLPAGWPNWRVHLLFFHKSLGLPPSLGAQLAAETQRYDGAVAASLRRVAAVQVASSAVNAQVDAAQAKARARIVYVTRTLKTEIPVVIPPTVDLRYRLPVGLVRIHDAAAAGLELPGVPSPPSERDDEPSPVAPSDLAGAIVDNYGAYHSCAAQLISWQDWYRGQVKAWNVQPAAAPAR